ncbi:hypothetical protein HPB51_019770 [Rhipicephalus microplus]|uniref:Uncharacterized protein n=1 Tax=Rhipicephalus microplus TaxID=6941 RepID=A0A9J6F887_RHIMP|nr:hypothetical protein HPB51_019770 [Rhipicephalus microplus]
MFNAYDSFTDAENLKNLQESYPTMPVVCGRRMGRTNHVLVTMLEDFMPRRIFYHGVYIRLYPFYPRVKACFNCHKKPTTSGYAPAQAPNVEPPTAPAINPSHQSLTVPRADVPASRLAAAAATGRPFQTAQVWLVPVEVSVETLVQVQVQVTVPSRSRSRSAIYLNSSSSPLSSFPDSSQGLSQSSPVPSPKKLPWAQGS